MKRPIVVLALFLSALVFASSVFAQHPTYVITNDDNPNAGANTGTVFVPGPKGQLTVLKTLETGGAGEGGGYFSTPLVDVGNNADCIFLADSGSGDIASFSRATGFGKVGNYSSPGLDGHMYGIGLVASQDGKFLYAAYSVSQNIQAWAIGTGANACALTAIGTPVAGNDYIGPMALTNDGKVLVVSEPNNWVVEAFSSNNGLLTPLGNPVNMTLEQECNSPTGGCNPYGMDITNVSGGTALVVVANGAIPNHFITLSLDENAGLTFLANTAMTNVGSLGNPETLVLSRDARSGNGNLYFGMMGNMAAGSDAGIAVFSVTNGQVNPAAVSYYDATLENGDAPFCSNVAIAEPKTGEGIGLWQSDTRYVFPPRSNVMWFYKLDGNTITPYAHLANPNENESPVVSIASVFGNPN